MMEKKSKFSVSEQILMELSFPMIFELLNVKQPNMYHMVAVA